MVEDAGPLTARPLHPIYSSNEPPETVKALHDNTPSWDCGHRMAAFLSIRIKRRVLWCLVQSRWRSALADHCPRSMYMDGPRWQSEAR